MINRIETHVQGTYDYVTKAKEQTKQAMEYQQKSRKVIIPFHTIANYVLLSIVRFIFVGHFVSNGNNCFYYILHDNFGHFQLHWSLATYLPTLLTQTTKHFFHFPFINRTWCMNDSLITENYLYSSTITYLIKSSLSS